MKLEHIIIGGGIILFIAIIGTFYMIINNKPTSYAGKKSSTDDTIITDQTSEDLAMAGKATNSLEDLKKRNSPPTATTVPTIIPPKMTINQDASYSATMKTSAGEITLMLEAKKAPRTVNNFVSLTRTHFYENTIFHRVIEGFMIQGGDPKGDGTGGPGYTIPAEIRDDLKHVRGAISMARLGDAVNPQKNSSGSQFFIMHKDVSQLDGQYTVFGHVTAGMDVVDKIASSEVQMGASGERSTPVNPVKILSIDIQEN